MSKGITLFAAFLAFASAQEPAFRADVSLVEIDAQVIGRTGVVEGLQLADFIVKDGRQPVTLRYCFRDETPLDIVLLFDLGKGMVPVLDQLRTGSEMAMAEFRDGDRAAVMSFDERVRVELPLTADLKEVKRQTRIGLEEAAFGNGFPSVLAAAGAAATYLAARPEPHQQRAVVMFTADIGDGKQESRMAVAKALWDGNALLSAMIFPNRQTRLTHDDNPLHLEDLWSLGRMMKFSPYDSIDEVAELTGGEIVYAGDVGAIRRDPNPNAALRQVIRRMRRRYKLYYDRPAGKPGQRREVEVGLTPAAEALHPGARIIARKGYVIPKRDSR